MSFRAADSILPRVGFAVVACVFTLRLLIVVRWICEWILLGTGFLKWCSIIAFVAERPFSRFQNGHVTLLIREVLVVYAVLHGKAVKRIGEVLADKASQITFLNGFYTLIDVLIVFPFLVFVVAALSGLRCG